MHGAVDEVGRIAAAEGIDCHFAKGGTVLLARSPAQVQRARAEVAEAREFGFGEADLRLLTAGTARELAGGSDVLGGTYTPHCAAIHPARLVRGLAEAVRRAGVQVFERTPVLAIEPHRVVTPAGTVSARYVVRATEGYTPGLPGQERAIAPAYSLMIATEPLPDAAWDQIGLAGRPTFGDLRHLIIYGQRTADGRLAFGGRGAPYHRGRRYGQRLIRFWWFSRHSAGPSASCSRRRATRRSRTGGAGRSASPGTGVRRWGWIAPLVSAGRGLRG
jgi:glycine/D-amino acid oxidase-like deaminating enzyme